MRRTIVPVAIVSAYAALMTNSALAADRIPGNKTTKARFACDRQASGMIDFRGDSDWYRVTLKERNKYVFSAKGKSLRVFDGSGRLVFDAFGQPATGTGTVQWRYFGSSPRTFFVAVGGKQGVYRLGCKIADLGDNSQTEGKLEVGKPGQGKLTGGGANNDSDDSDSFAVFLEASAQYRISVNATILINPKPIEGRPQRAFISIAGGEETGFGRLILTDEDTGQTDDTVVFLHPTSSPPLSGMATFAAHAITPIITNPGTYYLNIATVGVRPPNDVDFGDYTIEINPVEPSPPPRAARHNRAVSSRAPSTVGR